MKYNYFHKEQKQKMRNDPFLAQNLFYNKELDFYVCPMGQQMEKIGESKRISSNGYELQASNYQVKRCESCPLRGQCHQAKGNRIIQVNHRLNKLKEKAKGLLTSEKGLEHRSKRPIEVEAVFGQLKTNNKFNRFTFRGLEKVELEFLLMAIGHNFRKMSAKGAISSKIVFRIKINGSEFYFEIKIRSIRASKVYFLNNSNSNFYPLKFVA